MGIISLVAGRGCSQTHCPIDVFLSWIVRTQKDDVVLDFAINFGSKFRSLCFQVRVGCCVLMAPRALSERTVWGWNSLNSVLLWQQSLLKGFFFPPNIPHWKGAWWENRMDQFAQLANSLHSLNLVCTRWGSQHKLNPPRGLWLTCQVCTVITSSDPVARGVLGFVYCSVEAAYGSNSEALVCSGPEFLTLKVQASSITRYGAWQPRRQTWPRTQRLKLGLNLRAKRTTVP